MPVILADRDAQLAWLDPALGAEEALALCGRCPPSACQRAPANPAVNKAGDLDAEGPGLLVRHWTSSALASGLSGSLCRGES